MLAVIAAILFVLSAAGVTFETLDLTDLGLALLALHHVFHLWPGRNPQA